jgi:hypothetical protein
MGYQQVLYNEQQNTYMSWIILEKHRGWWCVMIGDSSGLSKLRNVIRLPKIRVDNSGVDTATPRMANNHVILRHGTATRSSNMQVREILNYISWALNT